MTQENPQRMRWVVRRGYRCAKYTGLSESGPHPSGHCPASPDTAAGAASGHDHLFGEGGLGAAHTTSGVIATGPYAKALQALVARHSGHSYRLLYDLQASSARESGFLGIPAQARWLAETALWVTRALRGTMQPPEEVNGISWKIREDGTCSLHLVFSLPALAQYRTQWWRFVGVGDPRMESWRGQAPAASTYEVPILGPWVIPPNLPAQRIYWRHLTAKEQAGLLEGVAEKYEPSLRQEADLLGWAFGDLWQAHSLARGAGLGTRHSGHPLEFVWALQSPWSFDLWRPRHVLLVHGMVSALYEMLQAGLQRRFEGDGAHYLTQEDFRVLQALKGVLDNMLWVYGPSDRGAPASINRLEAIAPDRVLVHPVDRAEAHPNEEGIPEGTPNWGCSGASAHYVTSYYALKRVYALSLTAPAMRALLRLCAVLWLNGPYHVSGSSYSGGRYWGEAAVGSDLGGAAYAWMRHLLAPYQGPEGFGSVTPLTRLGHLLRGGQKPLRDGPFYGVPDEAWVTALSEAHITLQRQLPPPKTSPPAKQNAQAELWLAHVAPPGGTAATPAHTASPPPAQPQGATAVGGQVPRRGYDPVRPECAGLVAIYGPPVERGPCLPEDSLYEPISGRQVPPHTRCPHTYLVHLWRRVVRSIGRPTHPFDPPPHTAHNQGDLHQSVCLWGDDSAEEGPELAHLRYDLRRRMSLAIFSTATYPLHADAAGHVERTTEAEAHERAAARRLGEAISVARSSEAIERAQNAYAVELTAVRKVWAGGAYVAERSARDAHSYALIAAYYSCLPYTFWEWWCAERGQLPLFARHKASTESQ